MLTSDQLHRAMEVHALLVEKGVDSEYARLQVSGLSNALESEPAALAEALLRNVPDKFRAQPPAEDEGGKEDGAPAVDWQAYRERLQAERTARAQQRRSTDDALSRLTGGAA